MGNDTRRRMPLRGRHHRIAVLRLASRCLAALLVMPLAVAAEACYEGFDVIHLTDPHLGDKPCSGDRCFEQHLRDAVAEINGLPRAAFAVITGDISATAGTPESYRIFRDAIEALSVPYHVVPGNHDDPKRLAQALGASAAGYRAFEYCSKRFVLLNSHLPGSEGGEIDDAQLRWLAQQLGDGKPSFVFLHHQILSVPADPEGLRNKIEFLEVLDGSRGVRLVANGHVHLSRLFRRRGVFFANTAAVSFARVKEGDPGYRIIRFSSDGAFRLYDKRLGAAPKEEAAEEIFSEQLSK